MSTTVLDHVAVGTGELGDGWQLFGGLLGGTWLCGGDSAGFWWGQLRFHTGPKIELITPTTGPDAAFLERFLASRGPGVHHLTFIVADIHSALTRISALGIKPVQVSLADGRWKEAFLHPRDAYGIVIQIAEQSGPPPSLAAPAELPPPGRPSDFTLVEFYVTDIDGASRLFRSALDGELVARSDTTGPSTAELTWQSGTRLRLVQAPDGGAGYGAGIRAGSTRLHFGSDVSLSPAGLSRAEELSRRLGVSLQLG